MHIVVDRRPDGIALIDDDGVETLVADTEFADAVRERESEHPRWVWTDTAQWYPPLLAAGVRVERCHDVRLVDGILAGIDGRSPRGSWGRAPVATRTDTLFDLDGVTDAAPSIAAPRA